jgi:hypothetical protein
VEDQQQQQQPLPSASAKYYSVPHRGDPNYASLPVSKQRSLEGDQVTTALKFLWLQSSEFRSQSYDLYIYSYNPSVVVG